MLKYIIGYFVIGFVVVFLINEIEKRRGNKSIADTARYNNTLPMNANPLIVLYYIQSVIGWPILLVFRAYKWAKYGFKKKHDG